MINFLDQWVPNIIKAPVLVILAVLGVVFILLIAMIFTVILSFFPKAIIEKSKGLTAMQDFLKDLDEGI